MRSLRILRTLSLVALLSSALAPGQAQDQTSPPAQPESPTPAPIHVPSQVTAGLLLTKIAPKYPKEARKKHIEGVVVMTAKITQQGEIVDLQLVSGPPIFAASAMDAVRQWKYRPYLVDGKPVEVETEIRVNFTLSR